MRIFGLIFVWFITIIHIINFGIQLGKPRMDLTLIFINLIFALCGAIAAIGLMR